MAIPYPLGPNYFNMMIFPGLQFLWYASRRLQFVFSETRNKQFSSSLTSLGQLSLASISNLIKHYLKLFSISSSNTSVPNCRRERGYFPAFRSFYLTFENSKIKHHCLPHLIPPPYSVLKKYFF